MKSHIKYLKTLGACQDAVTWADQFPDLATAWAKCERGDWMLWLVGKKAGATESEKRKTLVLAACECARLALPYAKSPAVLICIETAEKWARGEATIEKVREARRAAADAAAAYAAYAAAAAAADDAADAAAYAAADAAARKLTLARCADIVRKHYPKVP